MNYSIKRFFRKPPPQLTRVASIASHVFLTVIAISLTLTTLSRLGVLNVFGLSIILTNSMEPQLRPGDIVVYLNLNYREGDIVTYCVTPTHCIVHRVIRITKIDTVNGETTLVITKGDNVDSPDNPIEPRNIRGRVVLFIPREIWIPIIATMIVLVLYRAVKTPVIGYSYVTVFTTCLITLVAVYATASTPLETNRIKLPVINLSSIYFDNNSCYVRILYTGELSVTNATAEINQTIVETILLNGKEVDLKPPLELLRKAFETGKPLHVAVNASLNHIGVLKGEYEALIGGLDPEIRVENGVLLISNPNCFTIHLDVSIKYLDGGRWAWLNATYIIEGFSTIRIAVPKDSTYSYATLKWFNQGVERWVGLTLRSG